MLQNAHGVQAIEGIAALGVTSCRRRRKDACRELNKHLWTRSRV